MLPIYNIKPNLANKLAKETTTTAATKSKDEDFIPKEQEFRSLTRDAIERHPTKTWPLSNLYPEALRYHHHPLKFNPESKERIKNNFSPVSLRIPHESNLYPELAHPVSEKKQSKPNACTFTWASSNSNSNITKDGNKFKQPKTKSQINDNQHLAALQQQQQQQNNTETNTQKGKPRSEIWNSTTNNYTQYERNAPPP